MATQALDEVYEAEQSEQSEQDLAEVDQTGAGQEGEESTDTEESYNESLNEDNESLNEDFAMDAGEDTGEDADLTEEEEEEALSNEGKCIVELAQKLRIQHEYVHLVAAINGERYYFPGVGTAPDFLVPAYHVNGDEYMAEELIGKYLIALEPCQDGFQIKRRECHCPTSFTKQPPLSSPKPMSGFLDQQGKHRRGGSLAAMADESGTVRVLFGDDPVKEEVEEMEPPDVSDICTPPSDDQRVTQSE